MFAALFAGQSRPGRVARAGGLAAILVIGATAVAASATAEVSIPAITIAAGDVSQIHTLTRAVVRDQAAWTNLWRRHAGNAAAPPAVDFDREMVVAVFAGDSVERVALSITRIVRESHRLVVIYTLAPTRPMADAMGPVVAPFQIVRVARSTLPVAFMLRKVPQVLRYPGS